MRGVGLVTGSREAATGVVARACRSCGAPVVWARHESTGRRMPLDATPTDGGMFTIRYPDGPAGDAVYGRRGPEASSGHDSHFATCPDAKGWRGRAARLRDEVPS